MTVHGFWYAYLPLLAVLAVVALIAILLGFLIGRSRGRRAVARAEARIGELEAAQSRAAAVPVLSGQGSGAGFADGRRPEQPVGLVEGPEPKGVSEPGSAVAERTAAAVSESAPGAGETLGTSALPRSEQIVDGTTTPEPVPAAPDTGPGSPAENESRGEADPAPTAVGQGSAASYSSELSSAQVLGEPGPAEVPDVEPEASGGPATGRPGHPAEPESVESATPGGPSPLDQTGPTEGASDGARGTWSGEAALHEWTPDQVQALVSADRSAVARTPGRPTGQDWADTTSAPLPESGYQAPTGAADEGAEPGTAPSSGPVEADPAPGAWPAEPGTQDAGTRDPVGGPWAPGTEAESQYGLAAADSPAVPVAAETAGPAVAPPSVWATETSGSAMVPATAPWPGQAYQGTASEREQPAPAPDSAALAPPGVLPLPGPRPRPGRGWAVGPEHVRPASPGGELVQMRQALNRAETEMARLEAAAVQAWDRTVPALEARIEELKTENATLLRQLLATEAQLELMHERSQRQHDARRSELDGSSVHD